MTPTKLFGTDGIRDVAGEGSLRPESVVRIGRALGSLLREGTLRPGPGSDTAGTVLVARDPRASGPAIVRDLSEGILGEGIDVIDVGILTTPGLAALVALHATAAGVMISASHNPAADNGIKIFGANGEKLSEEIEEAIERTVARLEAAGGTAFAGTDFPRGRLHVRPEMREDYADTLVRGRFPDLDLDGLLIAIDSANGAAYEIAPRILERLGSRVARVACEPDGTNINRDCGALHPERIRAEVLRLGADLGLSLDGDGDRVVLVTETGEILDGDDLLLALAEQLQRERALAGDTVVATVMSNLGLELALGRRGIRMLRTPVGDRHVASEMRAGGFAIGGEQSGHIILRHGASLFGDGLAAALAILRGMRGRGVPLSGFAGGLERLPQVLVNVKVGTKPPFESLEEVQAKLRRAQEELDREGRILLRYSGTEPLARVMIEGHDSTRIRAMADEIADAIVRATGA